MGLPKPTTVGNLRDTGHSVGATPLAAMADDLPVTTGVSTVASSAEADGEAAFREQPLSSGCCLSAPASELTLSSMKPSLGVATDAFRMLAGKAGLDYFESHARKRDHNPLV